MANTTPKRSILSSVLARAKRPLTPAEIRAEALKEIPTLGIATVYRALKLFLAEGLVPQIEIQGTAPHYEIAGQQHHHFFFCDRCQRLFNLLGCVRGLNGLAPGGFQTERHEIILYGFCADCREQT